MTAKDQSITRTAAASGTLEAEKLEALTPTRAERLRALEAEFAATSFRALSRGGEVQLGLEFANGDKVVGRGITTESALEHLERRVASFRQEG